MTKEKPLTGEGQIKQSVRKESNLRHEIFSVLILGLICFLLFFSFLGDRPIWDVDEGKHAATSKDMVLSGDWITPRLNGEKFYDKPALFNWLVAISFSLFGFTEFAARLPAALLGLGCVFLTYLLGRRMCNPAVGFLGGAILATSPEFIILSRVVVHDIALAFFMTLTLSSFYAAFKCEPRRRTFLLSAYASAGFAVLGKGPIGALLPASIIGLFLLLKGRLSFLKRMEIGWGILVFLLVSAPWYIAISLRNEDYARYFFIQQNLMNFISSQEARHSEPFYYYFPVLMGGFFPWSFFLPLAFIRGVRKALERTSDEALFLLIWFGVIFIFFSTAGSKLGTYILPLYPAASLLVAVLWRELIEHATPGLHRGFLYSIVVLLAVLISGMAYVLIHPLTDLQGQYGIDSARIHAMVFLLTGGGILATVFSATRRFGGSFWTLVGMIVAGILSFVVLIVPSINPYRSTKGLAMALDRMIPPGENLVFFRKVKESTLFYTDRRATVLRTQRELRDYLDSEERVFCVIDRKRLDRMEKLKPKAHVLKQEGRKLLISNRPGP